VQCPVFHLLSHWSRNTSSFGFYGNFWFFKVFVCRSAKNSLSTLNFCLMTLHSFSNLTLL
jgi:hypothetical protein